MVQALKKQSRSRTKAAVEEIAAYALETHFTTKAIATQCTPSKRKSRGKSKDRRKRSKHSRSKKLSIRAPALSRAVLSIATMTPSADEFEEPLLEQVEAAEEEEEVGELPAESELESSDTSTSSSSEGDSEGGSDALFERILQRECEALLPSAMLLTRTMR